MFQGYCPETVDFLWGIRLNNNRDWFTAHKENYVNHLYQPTKALGQDVAELFRDWPGTVVKVSRIYRDARMHHPLPYKESLWICVRQDVQWWAENPCLYFEINPDGVHYGFFFWKPRPAVMEAIRRDIQAKPGKFLKLIRDTQKATGLPVTADVYKRPKPTDDPALEPFFAWKGQIACVKQEPFSAESFGPELGERVKTLMTQLMPLYRYFSQFAV